MTDVIVNKKTWKQRILIGTPVTGLVRIEWAERRFTQVIPTNWSAGVHQEMLSCSMPLRFQVADAQNIIVERAIREDFEWLFLVEQDNVLPIDAFIRINTYMVKKTVPVVSGLYFTKSVPPEPILYRGRGNGYFAGWKFGEKTWVDGVPTGCVLIHSSVLRSVWNESPEYLIGGRMARRVFTEPARIVYRPDINCYIGEYGTSDLEWCTRVMKEKHFEKSGWSKYAKMKYPFLVDTNLYCTHIDENGRQFPLEFPKEFIKTKKEKHGAKHKGK